MRHQVPTSPALIGRRHGLRSFETRPSRRRRFLKAALPPSCSRTGRCAERGVYPALRWSRFHPTTTPKLSGRCRSARFDWPTGGTEEFLGRWAARPDSRRTEAKGVLADPLNVFGAVDRLDGNRNDRTSRCRREEIALVARGNLFKTAASQVGNSGVRALTLVSINVGSHRTYRREPAMTSLPWRLTGNRRARVLVARLTRRAETDGGNRQASQVPGEPQRWPRRLLKTPAGPPSQAGTGEPARPPPARTAGAPAMRPNFGAGWAGSGHTLSTLRPVGRPTRTQDSLPTVGQTLPGGLEDPLGSSERF